MNERPSAGLPLSVGSASLPVRLLLAVMVLLVGGLCIGGGMFIARSGSVAGIVIAIAMIIPLGLICCIAAAFIVAPFSRFGVWLDEFVAKLNGGRAAAVFVVLWLVAFVLTKF
jgi:hypothetical protein